MMEEYVLDGWQELLLEKVVNEVWENLEFGGAAIVNIGETYVWHSALGKQLKLMAKDAGVSLRFYDRVDGSYRITLRRYQKGD